MPAHSTGFFTHTDCRRHEMGPGHPECPERLDAIEDRLLACGLADVLERREAPLASLADIELAHDRLHAAALRGLQAELEEQCQAGGPAYAHIDPDTALNAHTWTAALRAAGAAVAATDAVMAGELANAFCAVRPPGHHACRDRAMGFCFFNNVAIAARHALDRHGLSRVAVVDFDVHHGNGTEDILAGDERVLMVGIFQQGLYPFSGDPPRAGNMLNVPVPAYTRGPAVRERVERLWLPRLESFRPEMVFISAGFDAHRDDELGQLGLVEDDYRWITERVRDVALRHARGRIVSCLEGGYDLQALGTSVEAHLRALADL
ncbi:histone deacetylase family protein [Ramlibacter sp. AW1]|uniref:Histone deacetylase family protein n=1 Tax=Ramlibacter aurantiacus TaxID=2801330 RepID=A0A937D8L3_9BURK|nr:histone deacetylase family protein [Ramlibacter aurantiacus]MBL0423173.1 histone deacetylase family protein [Ramlibacter aurantiacus]